MNTYHLVLGSTGSIGYAYTKVLLDNKIAVTILVRNKEKALKLFGQNSLLEIVNGDANDRQKLMELAADKKIIFHGINCPYDQWEKNMEKVTKNVIEAAGINKATIIFPGNIYEFGNVAKISEEMIPQPETKKGMIRLRLHDMLVSATESNICKVIFIRLPDFFGPNVTNGLIKPIFGNAARKKEMSYLINADIPHQFVYTPDAARIMYQLSLQENLPAFLELNYFSFTAPSFRDWAKLIAAVGGGPSKVKVIPKWMLNTMALFIPVIKELKENYYLFENSVILDDKKVKKLFPDFQSVEMNEMIIQTIDWYKNNV